jgi:hypothetical protein
MRLKKDFGTTYDIFIHSVPYKKEGKINEHVPCGVNDEGHASQSTNTEKKGKSEICVLTFSKY